MVGVAIGARFSPPVANSLPWLEALSTVVLIAGIMPHIYDLRRKERSMQVSMNQYHSLVTLLWRTYLDSLAFRKDGVKEAQLQAAMKELGAMLGICVAQSIPAKARIATHGNQHHD